jgi:hypothetical protein
MKKRLFYIFGIILLFPLAAASAFGLTLEDFRKEVYRPENLPGGETGSVSAENKVVAIINFLINLILYASGSVAVLMLVYGGVRLITAGGDTEQKDQATKIIKFAGIGLFVVILAFALVTNVIDLIFRATT